MNRPTFILSAGLAALLVAFVLWWRARPSSADAEQAANDEVTRVAELAQRSSRGDAESRSDEPEWRNGGTSDSDPRVAKLFQGLRGGARRGRISRQAIEAFLASTQRSGGSLLAAWEESGDEAYLREAAKRFPDDPRVQLAAAMSPSFGPERAEWVERLKKSDPTNPLPNWIAAAEHFSGKRSKEAIAELLGSDGKTGFQNYSQDTVAERRALFEASGLEPMRAQVEAQLNIKYDYLGRLQSAARGIENELKTLRASGDAQTAQDLSATAVNIGRIMSGNSQGTLIDQLVGLSVESSALKQIPPGEAMAVLGTTTEQRAADLEKQRRELLELGRVAGEVVKGKATMEEVTQYFERRKRDGEIAALRWLTTQRAGR
jgi:hypothetical protein